MYVNREARLVYLAHPRTASSSVTRALQDECGFTNEGANHHAKLNEFAPSRQAGPPISGAGWRVCTTVRHPLDALVSWWFYWTRERRAGDVFGRRWITHLWRVVEHFPVFGEMWALHLPDANCVLRFENIESELNMVLGGRGLGPVELIHANAAEGREDRPYRTFYDESTLLWLEEVLGPENAALGYRWE